MTGQNIGSNLWSAVLKSHILGGTLADYPEAGFIVTCPNAFLEVEETMDKYSNVQYITTTLGFQGKTMWF